MFPQIVYKIPSEPDRAPPVLLGELGGLLAILQGSGRWEGSACIFLIFFNFFFLFRA